MAGFFLSPWGPFQVHSLQFVSPPPSCSTFFFLFLVLREVQVFLYLFVFFYFLSFFLFIFTRHCLHVGINWSICIWKNKRILDFLFTWADSGLWIYYLVVWTNFNHLHNSQFISFFFPCRTLYYTPFCTNLLYSLISWLTVSSFLHII